ncbi:MAG: glycosyltransferase [Chloroflexota bacterium]
MIIIIPGVLDSSGGFAGRMPSGRLLLAASQEQSGIPEPRSVTVSIVIPCYNYGRFLTDAIESALAQTLPAHDIVIVDDGSTDNTPEIAARYLASPGVRMIARTNQGAIPTYNAGVRASAGQFFVILSADDRLDPYFLERTVPILLDRPEAAYAYTAYRSFGVRQRALPALPYSARRLRLRPYIAATSLIRGAAFDQVGGFNPSMHGGREDWDFYVALAEHGWEGVAVPEVLFHYRKHGSGSRNAIPFRALLAARAQIYRNHRALYRLPLPLWLALTEIGHTLLKLRAAPRALLRRLGPNGRPLGNQRLCQVSSDTVWAAELPRDLPFPRAEDSPGASDPAAPNPDQQDTSYSPNEDENEPAPDSMPPVSGLVRIKQLTTYAIEEHAAIYHAVDFPGLVASVLAASVNRAYLIYEPRTIEKPGSWVGTQGRNVLERLLLWRVDALAVPNLTMADALRRRTGAQPTVLDYHGHPSIDGPASAEARLSRLFHDLLNVTGHPSYADLFRKI